MKKNIYEIFDEFKAADTKKQKQKVLLDNRNLTLLQVLQLCFHPDVDWLVKTMPEDYKKPDTVPGISFSSMEIEIRRFYLFQKGHPTAERLTPTKQKELLLTMLESLEPREAEIVMGIFKKDFGIKGLTYKLVSDTFPGMLP